MDSSQPSFPPGDLRQLVEPTVELLRELGFAVSYEADWPENHPATYAGNDLSRLLVGTWVLSSGDAMRFSLEVTASEATCILRGVLADQFVSGFDYTAVRQLDDIRALLERCPLLTRFQANAAAAPSP